MLLLQLLLLLLHLQAQLDNDRLDWFSEQQVRASFLLPASSLELHKKIKKSQQYLWLAKFLAKRVFRAAAAAAVAATAATTFFRSRASSCSSLQLLDKNAVNKTVKTGRMRSTQHTQTHTRRGINDLYKHTRRVCWPVCWLGYILEWGFFGSGQV